MPSSLQRISYTGYDLLSNFTLPPNVCIERTINYGETSDELNHRCHQSRLGRSPPYSVFTDVQRCRSNPLWRHFYPVPIGTSFPILLWYNCSGCCTMPLPVRKFMQRCGSHLTWCRALRAVLVTMWLQPERHNYFSTKCNVTDSNQLH